MEEKNNAPGTPEAEECFPNNSLCKDNTIDVYLQQIEAKKAENVAFDWSQYEIKVTDQYNKPAGLIYQGERLILSRGNIATITGKAKAGKGCTCIGIMASIEDECLTLTLDESIKRILYIDTEQANYHAQNIIKRVYRLCEWDLSQPRDELILLALRPKTAKERFSITEMAIQHYKPDLVFVDGVRDLLNDFNSIDESSEVVNSLMKWSHDFNCGIVNVIHVNKNDRNARGHCGTELINKSESVLEVVNNDGIITVTAPYSRNIPPDDFSFKIVKGLPQLCDSPKESEKKEKLRELIKKAMFGTMQITKKELVRKIVNLTGKKERTADRRIKDAIQAGILKENERGYLYIQSYSEIPDELLPF